MDDLVAATALPGATVLASLTSLELLGQVVEVLGFGTEGVYATPTGISATYIYLFILFGAFLERAGMIQLFNDVALGLVGWARGGAAKVKGPSSHLGEGVVEGVRSGPVPGRWRRRRCGQHPRAGQPLLVHRPLAPSRRRWAGEACAGRRCRATPARAMSQLAGAGGRR